MTTNLPADPREVGDVQDGTTLRDGAVTPRDTDFLGPTNAGVAGPEGNPHGPFVVNPELHAVEGNHPVRPGLVNDDPAVQSTEETAHMEEFLAEAPALPEAPTG